MRMLNDYECPACGVFEAWGSSDAHCPGCNRVAPVVIGPRGIALSFKDEGFPRAYRRWADQHERAARMPERE